MRFPGKCWACKQAAAMHSLCGNIVEQQGASDLCRDGADSARLGARHMP
jgi:hypothetical protein